MKKSIYFTCIFLINLSYSIFASNNVLNNNQNDVKSSDMVNVIASIEVKEGKLEQFLDIFNSNVPNVLAENGCIEYIPAIDIITDLSAQILNKNEVTVIEKWASMEDLQAHLAAPHMSDYRIKVKDLVSKVTLKVLALAAK
jgi:quinol monooxygenase YgiN